VKKRIEKFLAKNTIENVLVVRKHNQIGDMLCSLTLYAALKKKFPAAKITLVVSPTNYKIDYEEINPYIDKVLVYKKGSIGNILRFYGELRKTKFQIGIVPSTIRVSNTSHLINFFSGAKLKVGVKSINGKPNKAAILLNVKSDYTWQNLHQMEQNHEVVKQIGCGLTGEEINSIKINLPADDEKFADEFVKKNFPDGTKKIIAFHPGAGEKYKMWDTENFIKLMRMTYNKYNCYILVTAGAIDKDVINEILNSKELKGTEVKILSGASIKQLASVLKKTSLYITNNTGVLHIAHFAGAGSLCLTIEELVSDWMYKSENENYISAEKINDISVEEVFKLSCIMIDKGISAAKN
jgi:ADP-heptose:LPS heptosyltransferase